MHLLLLAACCSAAPADSPITIRPAPDPLQIEVVARLPASLRKQVPVGKLTSDQGERWLNLVLLNEQNKAGPAILGKYQRKQDRLIFQPRFSLAAGQTYRATLILDGNRTVHLDYQTPKARPAPPAKVLAIYPTASRLPANQLKFYIHFSKPMREEKEIFDRLFILDQDGKPVHDPWRRTELWTPDRKRLTLWIHPGRVKKGVNLREEFGPVLRPGRKYTLVIGAEVRDAVGIPLGRRFTKSFHATEEKHTRPIPQKWQVSAPPAKSRKPLRVRFQSPLDHALIHRLIAVTRKDGTPVSGRIKVADEERSWGFIPTQPWSEAEYQIVVDKQLEDLAGNTPIRIFDVDLTKPRQAPAKLTVPFRPR